MSTRTWGRFFARLASSTSKAGSCTGKKTFLCENRSRAEWLNRFFYKDSRLCHPSVLIRKKCHEVVGAYDDRYAQLADYDLWIRLCLRYEMYILPEELLAFRWLPQNANMSGRRPDSIKRRCWEYRRLLDHFLSIQDPAFFVQVFPEAQKHVGDLPERAIAICPGPACVAGENTPAGASGVCAWTRCFGC